MSATMERYEPSTSGRQPHHHHQDYSYAYYEPGAAMRHSNIPVPEMSNSNDTAGPSRPPPPNSIRALLSKGTNRNLQLQQQQQQSASSMSPNSRHTYTTRYGTQENIYEEIGDDGRMRSITTGHSMVSLNQSMVEEEFRRVQSRHRRILGELNLSVEAMIMPSTPPNDSPDEDDNNQDNLSELLNSVGPTDELLSPVSHVMGGGLGDLDSGFSGSSSGASYVGSLRYHRTGSVMYGFPTSTTIRSSRPGGDGGGSSMYCSSLRSSQRSQEDPGIFSNRSSSSVYSATLNRSAEDPGPSSSSNQTKPPKTSFWRKGWRKFPGFSSTSSVNKAGTGMFIFFISFFLYFVRSFAIYRNSSFKYK